MKIRDTFVSNSSSASFVLSKKNLPEFIINHIVFDLKNLCEEVGLAYYYDAELWDISQDEDFVYGFTSMDNLEIKDLFCKLNISENQFKIDSDNGVYGDLDYNIDNTFFNKFS